MKVVLLLLLVAVTAVTSFEAENFTADGENVNSLFHEIVADASEVDMVEEESQSIRTAFVETPMDASEEDMKTMKEHATMMVSTMGMPISLLEEELATHKAADLKAIKSAADTAGYQEMGPIMQKLAELEGKVSLEMKKDATFAVNLTRTCTKNKIDIRRKQSSINARIRLLRSRIALLHGDIKKYNDTIQASQNTGRRLESQVRKTQNQRDDDISGYKERKRKRMHEIMTLNKAIDLCCTFASLKGTATCKVVIKRKIDLAEGKNDKIDNRPLGEILKEAKEAEQKLADKWAAEKAANKDGKGKESDKNKQTEFVEVEATEEERKATTDKMEELEMILRNDEIPPRTFIPIRRTLTAIQMGKENDTLVDLLVELLQRITDEQKRETLDYLAAMKEYRTMLENLQKAINAETERQLLMQKNIETAKLTIKSRHADILVSEAELTASRAEYSAERKRCKLAMSLYYQRKAAREVELENIGKLRSLLRVLRESKLPKCPGDCTHPTHGKCVWKGKFGKESYCSCNAIHYGKSCEFKRCPGLGGTLLEHTHRDICSRHGTCDTKTGKCGCRSKYLSGSLNACENVKCASGSNGRICSGRGTCQTKTGNCDCSDRFFGLACEHFKCPTAHGSLVAANDSNVCGGRGACKTDTGKCFCSPGFYGSGCQFKKCPSDCLGRGECNSETGVCKCKAPYFGTSCNLKKCPGGGSDGCNGGGKCDNLKGQCFCKPEFSGKVCRRTGQCGTSKVNWVLSFDKKGWSECPAGHLMVGLERSAGNALFNLERAMCAMPCEGPDGKNGKPIIFKVEACESANWWGSFDHKGWSKCPVNKYMQGLWRNSCESLYCIEVARCCGIENADYARCAEANWWSSFDSAGLSLVSKDKFMTSLYRTGDISNKENNLYNLEMAGECGFRSRSTL